MFIKKTTEGIIKRAVDVITENTPITNMHAGGIARSIVEAIAEQIGTSNREGHYSLYDFAQDVLDQGYISRATGEYLDLIGGLFNYPRRQEEIFNPDTGSKEKQYIGDQAYRYEISKRVTAAVSSNYESVRLSVLQVSGVQNVISQEYSHGTGSFSFIVIPQYGFDAESVKHDVEAALQQSKAFGIRPHVRLPVRIPLDMTIQLVFKEGIAPGALDRIAFNTKRVVHDYIGNFNIGQELLYHDLVQEIMNSHENIIDFKIIEFFLNNQPVLLTNHRVMDDERIRPGVIEVL